MSIASQISALQSDKTAIAGAITAKGGIVNSGDGFDDFAADIATIPAASSTKYGCNIDNFLGDVDTNGVLQEPTEDTAFVLPNTVTEIGEYALAYVFYKRPITSVSFPAVTTIRQHGFDTACNSCESLTSASFPVLTTVDNYGLRSTFTSCRSLTTISFPALTSIGTSGMNSCFSVCSALTDVYFNGLTTSSTFGSNAFTSMLTNTGKTTTHTLHFPSNLQSTISGLAGYPSFGGTSGYVVIAYDLPATS